MPNPWFRMYSEFADDAKVQILSEAMQRRLLMLMCSRCKEETLRESELAFHWRISPSDLAETKAAFIEQGFIDKDWNLLNWNRRQFLSDSSTDRVRKYRQGKKQDETLQETDVTKGNVTVTPPEADTEAETETKAEKKPIPCEAPVGARGTKKPERVPDPRHTPFRNEFSRYFTQKTPSAAEAPWGPDEAKHLATFLIKNPRILMPQWQQILLNRARSEVPHGENLSAWIARALVWLDGPTNQYGKRPNLTGGNSNGKLSEPDLIASRQKYLDDRAARRLANAQDHAGGPGEAGLADPDPGGAGSHPGLLLGVGR